MGKLNIAHHKSYHPYRRDNIERVRRDEEAARLAEEGQEGRMRVANSEARLDLLRERAGGSRRAVKRREDGDDGPAPVAELTTIAAASGHINLFGDVEQHATSHAMVRARDAAAKGAKTDDEKGIRLAPSAKDLKPWYVDREGPRDDMGDERRIKDLSSKTIHDPLTSIRSELARASPARPAPPPPRRTQPPASTADARVQREAAERARAVELVRRKKRERERAALGLGNVTPSSAGGEDGGRGGGYGDVYNRKETEEAHSRRDRGWARGRDRGPAYREHRW